MDKLIQSQRDTILAGGNVNQIAGDSVAGDKITHLYQQILRPLPVKYSALVRPLIEHYTAVFGGRDAELAALDTFLADPQHPFGLLVASTGMGKTALLVHWIARVQQQHPQWRIIFAPVSIRYQTASEQVVLGLLAHSLAEFHHDLDQFNNYDQSPHSLRALITDYLRRPLPDGVRLLLVLDGIDEATGWMVGPLCAAPPQPGLKIVVAARQRANAIRDDYQHQLGWTNAPVAHLNLQALDLPSVAALLRQSAPARATDPDFVTQFYRVSAGDPLTCNLLVKALIGGNLTPESLSQRPPGLEAFLKGWVETLRKQRQSSRSIRELLALCAAAYGPLSSDDLQAMAPEAFPEQADIVDAVHNDQVARFIITVGEHTYVFSHQRLREVFLEQIYPAKDRERLQQCLIAYGHQWYADRTQPLPDYVRQFWIAHLKAAGEWESIRQVLTEMVPRGEHTIQPWQTARYAAEGSDSGYLSDLDTLWSHAEATNDLALALRCALIAASLRSRSGNLTPELLVQLVTVGTPEGKWSAVAALETIAQMPGVGQQDDCIAALVEAGIDLPWARAMEVACANIYEGRRAHALAALAPHLPPDLLAEALDVAQAITDATARAKVLGALAPHLPSEQQPTAYKQALAITDEYARARALVVLSPHLPHVLLHQALAAAQAITSALYRAASLKALAPHLPPEQQPAAYQQAFAAAKAITDVRKRADALGALAFHLPPEQQPAAYQQALAATRAIADGWSRAKALAVLAPHLPPDMLNAALADAQAITDAQDRAQVSGVSSTSAARYVERRPC
ncbi:hypothetical protein OSCT_1770 [Oscillochloris trichoides DG-6]|uniref:NACHT domain-containing protein n=1 Tax=Oscillochloris trichoides DG-6 TaxID=765420 RepID=E1IEL9_9CHLR|nr:ATP-binding protein [Oscillochloris trichoides]EFO80411.1 hypothetical protein OSCT_1770 [Oscillochloris trichoides DG-6]